MVPENDQSSVQCSADKDVWCLCTQDSPMHSGTLLIAVNKRPQFV